MIEFSTDNFQIATLTLAAFFPFCLAIVARIPSLRDQNALQFLIATIVVLLLWIALLVAPALKPSGFASVAIAAMILACALLVYLEVWALLSRGYTLGVLLTLLASASPLTQDEIALRYRSGDSLEWIISHRMAGLASAGLVRIDDRNNSISLTPLGMAAVFVYRTCIYALGLKRTG